MQIFSEYIQPFSIWLYDHPNWALFITFLISFSESLAIVGSIIPGSVTMTAVGILAGSGVMRIDLTLLCAILGAVAGDGISYLIGYQFRHSLPAKWPFRKYPHWLEYGKTYFAQHGGKSVLIGRFIGPLRSIIPLIAGMMHMNRWHFLAANVISAIGWSFLYVMPGILIGAASSELSSENASRLFVVILMLLVSLWILSMILKWGFVRVHHLANAKLHSSWLRVRASHYRFIYDFFTPRNELVHHSTAGLLFLFVLSFFVTFVICVLTYKGSIYIKIDTPVYYFLQSLQTTYFETFFIFISLIFKPLNLLILYISIVAYLAYHKDWQTLLYWFNLFASTLIVVYSLNYLIPVSRPEHNLVLPDTFYFPSVHLTIATSLFSFLILYISSRYRTTLFLMLRIMLVILLLMAGLAILYLSTNWFSSVVGAYLTGVTIALAHWLLYRIHPKKTKRSHLPIVFSFSIFLLTGSLYNFFYLTEALDDRHPKQQQYFISEKSWWNNEKLYLPIFTKNRVGSKTGVFNIQYAGDINALKNHLLKTGWINQPTSFFPALLSRIENQNLHPKLPMMSQLYNNQRPKLVMTYHKEQQPIIVIHIWHSNFQINSSTPLWIGSLYPQFSNKTYKANQAYSIKTDKLLFPLKSALENFEIKKVKLPYRDTEDLRNPVEPVIFFIQQNRLE